MIFDDWIDTGVCSLSKGDQVQIVAPDGRVLASALTVREVYAVIGDWLDLANPDGTTYMRGNMASGASVINTSHLPPGWRFERLDSRA